MKGRGENEMDTPFPPHTTNHILFETSIAPNIIFTYYYSATLLVLGLMFMRVLTADHLVS